MFNDNVLRHFFFQKLYIIFCEELNYGYLCIFFIFYCIKLFVRQRKIFNCVYSQLEIHKGTFTGIKYFLELMMTWNKPNIYIG